MFGGWGNQTFLDGIYNLSKSRKPSTTVKFQFYTKISLCTTHFPPPNCDFCQKWRISGEKLFYTPKFLCLFPKVYQWRALYWGGSLHLGGNAKPAGLLDMWGVGYIEPCPGYHAGPSCRSRVDQPYPLGAPRSLPRDRPAMASWFRFPGLAQMRPLRVFFTCFCGGELETERGRKKRQKKTWKMTTRHHLDCPFQN